MIVWDKEVEEEPMIVISDDDEEGEKDISNRIFEIIKDIIQSKFYKIILHYKTLPWVIRVLIV